MAQPHPIYRRNNPHRPVAWRWELVNYWLDSGRERFRHSLDPYLYSAIRFQRLLRSKVEEAELLERMEAGYEAWRFAYKPELTGSRTELEARLLTDQSWSEVGQALGVDNYVVRLYEAWFFNVRDRLHNAAYIREEVLGLPPLFWEPQTWRADQALKIIAYFGGKELLGELLQRNSGQDIQTWLDRQCGLSQRLNSWITVKSFQPGIDDPEAAMRNYLRLRELEQAQTTTTTGGEADRSLNVANIAEFVRSLPWRRADLLETQPTPRPLSLTGACLRSNELLLLANDELPETVLETVQSATFPAQTVQASA